MTGPELKNTYMILLSSLVYVFHPLYSGPLSMRQKFSKNKLITILINMNVVYEVAYSLAFIPFFFSLV